MRSQGQTLQNLRNEAADFGSQNTCYCKQNIRQYLQKKTQKKIITGLSKKKKKLFHN